MNATSHPLVPARSPQDREMDSHENKRVDIEDLIQSLGSFQAVIFPVTLTMLLSSFASAVITDPDAASLMAQSYLIYKAEDGDSDSTLLGHAFVNAIVIVGFFIVATFVIVICYKFKFTNFLVGYLFLSCVCLLGLLGGRLVEVSLSNFDIAVDVWSYWFIMYNFAVVGVLAIFYQKGVTTTLTQSYLVAISVIMAWQFSKFPEWTTWALVVVLAFYDLCAVLTPCGPLKCLVNLIQQEGRPLPGLIYEAEVQTTFHSTHAGGPDTAYYQRGRPFPERTESNDASVASSSCSFTRRRSRQESDEETGESGREPLLAESAPPTLRDRLVAFYTEFNPSAIPRVDQVLAMYEGREADLWADLAAKYGVDNAEDEDNTIKLGLGDFVFYSVLVSRAAVFDVSAMWACLVSILMGLGGTLFLLNVYKKALPALPISILLSVAIYLWLRFVLIGFIDVTQGVQG